jgi:hypothetical protein
MARTNRARGPHLGIARAFNFICFDCGREEYRPTDALPEGWDKMRLGDRDKPFVRCPDCAETVEQEHFARHAATEPAHEGATAIPLTNGKPLWVGVDWAKDIAFKIPVPPSFSAFLERQADGRYLIALTPEAVLMRWLPLGFFLEPGQARTLAAELTGLADLADAPGTLGAGE